MSGEEDTKVPAKKAPAEDFAVLPIPGARGRVEVVGTRGIFYKVRQGGEILKRRRGGWPVQMKNGSVQKLNAAGWLPGFQTLYLENDKVYRFGADVGLAPRILSFLPLAIIPVNPYIGGVLAIVLFFYNVYTIKNPQLPTWVKIALPIMNTIAGILITIVIKGG